MNIETLRSYCLSLPHVTEGFPFDNETLVFKIGDKLFLLTSIHSLPLQFNVKCDPELAVELRDRYPAISPGYHMNKKHWNTVTVDGTITENQLKEWINHSYQLVFKSLPAKIKANLT